MLSELKTQTEYIPLCKTEGKKEKEDRLYGQQNYVFFPCYLLLYGAITFQLALLLSYGLHILLLISASLN